MKVHPVADYFPMMLDDELQALAEDIKANGLIHPIIRDKEGQLIDGRNRLKACKMAGVEPRFEELNGQDPVAFIVSANLARRNMTKGQQAMALAMIYPEPEKGRGKKDPAKKDKDSLPFSQQRLMQARAVLRLAQQYDAMKFVTAVMAGELGLDDALSSLKEIDEKASSEKDKADASSKELANLRKAAPDLAEQVDKGTLKLGEAKAAFKEREAERAKAEESATSLLRDALAILTPLNKSPKKHAAEIVENLNPKYWKGQIELTPGAIQLCSDVLADVAKGWKEKARA